MCTLFRLNWAIIGAQKEMRKAIHEAEETRTEKAWKNILKAGGSNSSSFWATRRKTAGNQSSDIECVQDTQGATTTSSDIVKPAPMAQRSET